MSRYTYGRLLPLSFHHVLSCDELYILKCPFPTPVLLRCICSAMRSVKLFEVDEKLE